MHTHGVLSQPETFQSLVHAPRKVSARRGTVRQPTQCMAMPLALVGSSGSSFQAMQQMASGLGFAIGALWIGSEFLKDQQRASEQNQQECVTCSGTGFVDCMCSRWSDGDTGCGTCRGSGKMVCHHCGGGGTAVPISAKLYNRGGPRQ